MVKYCPKCGTPNEDDALYCVKCGNPLRQMLTIETQKPETEKSEKTAFTSSKHNEDDLKAFYILISIALILLGILAFIVTKYLSILFFIIIIILFIYILYKILPIKETYKEILQNNKELIQTSKEANQVRKELNQTLKSLVDLIKTLEEKYAKEGITKEEFLQKKADLENTENKIKTKL
jgi:uncharacterized membrane protein YvbJ